MKRPWIMLAAAAAISLSPLGAAAQGPQGVGAGEAARSAAPPSYNPLKWMKKKPPTATESLEANSETSARLASNLEKQGLLPETANLAETCATFQDLGGCVAALHAGHDLGLNFNCLKSELTGVQTSVYMSSCANVTNGKPMSLKKAIHALKPDANSKFSAKHAEEQSREDLAEAGFTT
jgi:hypothetical protein